MKNILFKILNIVYYIFTFFLFVLLIYTFNNALIDSLKNGFFLLFGIILPIMALLFSFIIFGILCEMECKKACMLSLHIFNVMNISSLLIYNY